MERKTFDDISVQDITEAATINRATFYDHYADKFALLDAMVAGRFHMLLHERNVQYDGTCPSAAGAIILAACDYLVQTQSNSSACQRQSAFEPLAEAAVTTAIRRVLLTGMPQTGLTSGISPEMIATTASWAIYGAIKQWFETPDRAPAEEVVPLVLQLILPILQTASFVQTASPAKSQYSSST
jgi:AcrR family transcriptional regulator